MEAELKQYLDEFAARFQQMDSRFEKMDSRFEKIDARFEKIDARFEKMDARFDELRAENSAAHEETRRVLRAESAAAHEETRRVLRAESAAAHEETRRVLRAENAAMHEETRRLMRAESEETRLHFDVIIDRVNSKFDLLGDGIKNLDEKIDREAADIRAEMRQGFADTHALIRFSHAQRTRRAKH